MRWYRSRRERGLDPGDGHGYSVMGPGCGVQGKGDVALMPKESAPYRCRHHVVTVGGESCYICGLELAGTSWHEEWQETSIQSPSRPMPAEHGIGRVAMVTLEQRAPTRTEEAL